MAKLPRGRATIRKGHTMSGQAGPRSTMIKLWTFDTKPDTTLGKLEVAYFAGLNAVDRAEERTKTSTASGKFTAEGVRDDVLQFTLNDLVPSLHEARRTVAKAKSEIAERRSKLQLKAADPTDIAAAMRRQEIRAFLRGLSDAEQSAYFARNDDKLPREVAQAIMEQPPELSGVPKSRHDLLLQN